MSLANLNLKAVWLSVNQAQPLLKFQTDIDEKTGEEVLTCFLLPQLEYKPENHFNGISNDEDAEEEEDVWEDQEDSRTTSVKFTDDVQNEKTKETPFVRQNTPHPKELKMKAKQLFGKGKLAETTISETNSTCDNVALTTMTITTASTSVEKPPVDTEVGDVDNSCLEPVDRETNFTTVQNSAELLTTTTNSDPGISSNSNSDMEDAEDEEKHVVFDVNASEKEANMKTSKLHRRDTPHHLKNKRIAPATLDPVDQEREAALAAALRRKCEEELINRTESGRTF
jgi:protein scribble